MNKQTVTLSVELTLDGKPDKEYVQLLAENVANALQHVADEVGLSPSDSDTSITEIVVNSLPNPITGEYFRIMRVVRP